MIHRQLKRIIKITAAVFLFAFGARGQEVRKVIFDVADSTNGYYLAIPPVSKNIKGVIVLFCNRKPESILPETRLHNVASVNDLLTVYASMGNNLFPHTVALDGMNRIFADITSRWNVDLSRFAVGGYDLAGMSVLRYAEQAHEHPAAYKIQPNIVFCISSFVDVLGLYRISERQIKKNHFQPTVNDSKFFIEKLNKELGTPDKVPERYTPINPFNSAIETPGNEQFLKNVALRLYYDTDINWQLQNRGNGYYDTYLPDGSELINRLMLQGNKKAELISSKQPGMRSNGMRHPGAYSIVDETDCIQWIKRELHIFDPVTYVSPYVFGVPEGWRSELTAFPPPFAPSIKLQGIEEIRFPKGWGVAGSNDYWSVAYLLWLETGQKINESVLKEALTSYFDGLVIIGGGAVPHNIPQDKLLPTRVEIKKIASEPDDLETYSGTINMLDYMAMKPIALNYRIHLKNCEGKDHFPLFFEISPKPFSDKIWYDLESLKKQFTCKN